MDKSELLAPAGNRECLETAFYFGADAAYAAGNRFGLRAFAANFDDDGLRGAIGYAHGLGKKLYVTVNAVIYERELAELADYLLFLRDAGADAVIFSDPAVPYIVEKQGIRLPLHLSPQANAMNSLTAAFWRERGVRRVVMSRETSLADIRSIRKNCPSGLEIEAFVHGAMCIAHSGRCLLSTALTGRSGNRGACAQPCRWEYYLHEKGYEGEYLPISEDERGTYILNSRDLMMIGHIPEMADAGITSFKIEGRMKSAYYVASVVSAYRRAIDAYAEKGEDYALAPELKRELESSAARGFTTGFFFGNPMEAGQDIRRDEDPRRYTFAGKVMEDAADGFVWVEQRNKFSVGEELEILSPHTLSARFTVEQIRSGEGGEQQSAPHAQQRVLVNCPYPLKRGDLLRRRD